jgi:hypothetical protein
MNDLDTVKAQREYARRHPKPLYTHRTSAQVADDLKRLKCDKEKRPWNSVRVVREGPEHYNIVERVLRGGHANTTNVPASQRQRGRLRKQLSPHAQLYSWLRTNDWDLRNGRVGTPNLHVWLRPNGELRNGLVAAGHPLTAGQVRLLNQSLTRFRRSLLESVGLERAFVLFTELLERRFRVGGVGSLLPRPSTRAFASHLCEFAQLIKVTKSLYVQVLVMKAKMKELATLMQCKNPVTVANGREFRKRLRGVWGVFHRTCMPALVYIRAWSEYLGLAMHGTPFGPVFFFNLWAYYVRNALSDIAAKRRQRALKQDARKLLQDTTLRDFRLILDPDALYAMLDSELHAPLPASRKSVGDDPWAAGDNIPLMPGPPPEYAIEGSLADGWDDYINTLPDKWQQWLGTKAVTVDDTERHYRYRQYELDADTRRLTMTRGDDVEKSVMFRFDGNDNGGGVGENSCLVARPARRNYLDPPARRAIDLYLIRQSSSGVAAERVQQIALSGLVRSHNRVVAIALSGGNAGAVAGGGVVGSGVGGGIGRVLNIARGSLQPETEARQRQNNFLRQLQ